MSSHSLGIRDAYKLYRKSNKDGVLLLDYLDITGAYIEYVIQKLLEGDAVQLTERLGYLEHVGVKVKPKIDENGNITGLATDWKSTNELWKNNPEAKERKERIYYFNEHTQGLRYCLRWSKKRVFVSNKEFYTFRLSFTNKKRFKNSVLAGNEYYVQQQKLQS